MGFGPSPKTPSMKFLVAIPGDVLVMCIEEGSGLRCSTSYYLMVQSRSSTIWYLETNSIEAVHPISRIADEVVFQCQLI